MESDIVVAREGALARLTLDRPRAINALTIHMVHDLHRALERAVAAPDIHTIVIDGAGERGFCAGGDVTPSARDSAELLRFLDAEYELDLTLAESTTPIVSWMDGITMGGGIGLGGHVQHRLVTERSRLAMPEVKIGFVPDVGGSLLLANAPGRIGEYLALTGDEFTGSDALSIGFADALVPSSRYGELLEALREGQTPEVAIAAVTELSAATTNDSELVARRPWIDFAFSHDSVPEILDALNASRDDEARAAAHRIRAASPAATVAALATIRRARALGSVADALALERRVAEHLVPYGDMAEGVTARLIEKRAPKWRDASAADVELPWLDAALAG